jgi:hypothetical protein
LLDKEDRIKLGIKHYTFSEVVSPREYNYTSDKVYFDLTLNVSRFKKTLTKLIFDNEELFQEILDDRHKSRSGFISFYSNDLKDWLHFDSSRVTSDSNNSIDEIMFQTYLIFYCQVNKNQFDIDKVYDDSHEALY